MIIAQPSGSAVINYQLGLPLRIIGIVGSLGLLLSIFELVRRRQLKEEYTVLWVLTGVVLLLLAAWGRLLRLVAEAIGASSEASTMYFFGLIFVVFLLLHFSVRVSRLERRVISLLQEIALLGGANHNGAGDSANHNGAGDGAASESAPGDRQYEGERAATGARRATDAADER